MDFFKERKICSICSNIHSNVHSKFMLNMLYNLTHKSQNDSMCYTDSTIINICRYCDTWTKIKYFFYFKYRCLIHFHLSHQANCFKKWQTEGAEFEHNCVHWPNCFKFSLVFFVSEIFLCKQVFSSFRRIFTPGNLFIWAYILLIDNQTS